MSFYSNWFLKQYCSATSIKISIVSEKDQPIKSVLSPRYWRFNEEMRTMDPGYPKPITIWRGVPDSPQGAFVDKANGTSCPVPSRRIHIWPSRRRRAASCASRPSSIQRPAANWTVIPERSRID